MGAPDLGGGTHNLRDTDMSCPLMSLHSVDKGRTLSPVLAEPPGPATMGAVTDRPPSKEQQAQGPHGMSRHAQTVPTRALGSESWREGAGATEGTQLVLGSD